jgi:hypothetical protein
MKKPIKKITKVSGLALALSLGVAMLAKPAFATVISPGGSPAYLSAPELSTTSTDPGTGPGTFLTTLSNGNTFYVTPTSTFGNTFVSPGPGISGVSATTSYVGDINYNVSGLNLQFINSINDPYTLTGSNGVVITGQVVSNVFAIGSGATMAGAVPGELVFTYQFSVDSISPTYGSGPNNLSISFFDEPNGTGMWTLGDGIISTATGGGSYTQIPGGASPTCNGGSCSNGYSTIVSLFGTEQLNTANGAINSATYTTTASVGLDQVTPEFFVASNAFAYELGSLSVGSGSGGSAPGVNVFVPGVPEPSTLILFGTALGLTAFMVVRKRRNQMVA